MKLKEETKVKQKEEFKRRYQHLNTILTQGIMTQENWMKINKILINNKKSKIWKETANKNRITEDFKKLYKHTVREKIWENNKVANIIKEIIAIIQENILLYKKEDKLFTPFSKAKDYNGFSQKIIINSIKGDNIDQEINNLGILLTSITEGFNLFLHNKIRTVLFKKKEDADEQKNLRTISIIPAWLMVVEKIAKPLIQYIINKELNQNQFGFRPLSDCGLAKAMIFYKSKKYNYKKALLIDIQKAYDSVNLDILTEIIDKSFDNVGMRKILKNFIELYKGLVLIINGTEINMTRGLPQGSALSPLFFNLYINGILKQINQNNNTHGQAYADDIIIQGNDINNLQKQYDLAKLELNKIDLKINPEKCELISDNEDDYIKDIDGEGNEIKIKSVEQAKYLGQNIKEDGTPIDNPNSINFNYLNGILTKVGNITKTAKIRIFQTFVRSKFNHLLPMICLKGKIEEIWKKIRRFIFNNLIEHNTLPRESASAFGLGFYDIIIRPLKKLIERNKIFTDNNDETEMLNDCLITSLKYWLKAEPNHTKNVLELIIDNIEKKTTSTLKEFDLALANECTERLYKNTKIDKENATKLKKVKSPSLIILLSNEPEHEIKEKLIKLYREKDPEKKKYIENKMITKIIKIKTAIEYAKRSKDDDINDITENIDNEDDQIINYIIKEILIKKEWNKIKSNWEESSKAFITQLINQKKNKNKEDINTTEIKKLINTLREKIGNTTKKICKNIEIALEMSEVEEFHLNMKKKTEPKQKNGPGRPKKYKEEDSNQTKLEKFFKN